MIIMLTGNWKARRIGTETNTHFTTNNHSYISKLVRFMCPGELHMTTWTSLDPGMQTLIQGLKCSACSLPIKTLHINSVIPLDEP